MIKLLIVLAVIYLGAVVLLMLGAFVGAVILVALDAAEKKKERKYDNESET